MKELNAREHVKSEKVKGQILPAALSDGGDTSTAKLVLLLGGQNDFGGLANEARDED